jgi:hypothetical protein
VGMCLVMGFTYAPAQTTVTTNGGTTGTVPIFTGNSAIGDSPISVSGTSVGVGTTNPASLLHLQTASSTNTLSMGAGGTSYGYFQIVRPDDGSGIGKTDFVDQYGGAFFNWKYRGGTVTALSLYGLGATNSSTYLRDYGSLYVDGNVGIGTTLPRAPLQINHSASSNTINEMLRLNNMMTSGGNNIPGILFTNSYASDPLVTTDQAWGVSACVAGCSYFKIQYKGGSNDLITPFLINGSGNVGIGTMAPGAKLEVNGSLKLTSGSGGSITFQDGTTQSTAWTGVVCGGDYAESVDVSGDRRKYEPGDVLVIDPDAPGKFLKSAEPYSTAVLGIYSTKPGTVGRRQTTPKSADEVPMAMIGIVPTKVSAENGPIHPGDLLVSASTPGYAMKGTDRSRLVGAVIGKALGRLDSGTGVIEVGVTLQ